MLMFEVFRDDGIYLATLHLPQEDAGLLAEAVKKIGPFTLLSVDEYQTPPKVWVGRQDQAAKAESRAA